MKIIETNLNGRIDEKDSINIIDHQSRVIEADSWEQYVSHYYSPEGSYYRNKFPYTLPRQCKIMSLKADDYHLSCIIDNGRLLTYRLACIEGIV